MEGNKEVRIIKITNPLWIGQIGPSIQKYAEQLKNPTITYESLHTYFTSQVQFGGKVSEFWVAQSGDETIAFAHWVVKALPSVATAYLTNIYSWNRMREPVQMLIDQFEKFGKENRCIYYEADVVNEAVYKVCHKAAVKRGYNLEKTGRINFLGRK
jgi:hypothetical protein